VIVRISGLGQYELDDAGVRTLDKLDDQITSALNAGDEQGFHQHLQEIIRFVQSEGKEVAADQVIPSDVIVPPEDITLEEARRFFTDEGLMHPLPA
jgi:hypothetical protein